MFATSDYNQRASPARKKGIIQSVVNSGVNILLESSFGFAFLVIYSDFTFLLSSKTCFLLPII